jgi:steroid delta-isomerase-like uncharacterized protein
MKNLSIIFLLVWFFTTGLAQEKDTPEQNKILMRHIIEEVWNKGEYSIVDELVSDEYISQSAPETFRGLDSYKQFYSTLRTAFPDIRFTIEDQIAEGDKVVTRWIARATHTGEYQGISPTGRKGVITGITINRTSNGKIIEGWTNWDTFGLLKQLGVIDK